MTRRAGGRHAVPSGAGAVGPCTALSVLRYGWQVTVPDPQKPGSGAPGGTAGRIVAGIVTPVPGRAPRHGNACFASARAHDGLTCAAASGTAVADMAAGRQTDLDFAPFAAARF